MIFFYFLLHNLRRIGEKKETYCFLSCSSQQSFFFLFLLLLSQQVPRGSWLQHLSMALASFRL